MFGKNITKFDGTDFSVWKFEVTQALMAHSLDDMVDGARTRPTGSRDHADVKAWAKDNAKAMSIISSAMDRRQLQNLIMCRTAQEMWAKLTTVYEQRFSCGRDSTSVG